MNAQQLKNSILQEAIEGRLVPQDPNDEPASVLLNRIREEKKRLVKEGKLKKKDLEETPVSEDEKPFEIPESWEWVRMQDVIEFVNGRAYKRDELLDKGKYKVLRVGNFFTNESWYYSDLELPDEKYCYKDDLLYAWSASFGPKIWDGDKTIFHYHIWNVKYNKNILYRDYLFYFFLIDKESIKSATTGSTMIHVSMENMKPRLLPLPPLAEQKRIVAKIEELLPKVEEYGKAQEALDKLNEELPEKLKKSILQEAIEGRLVPQDPNDEPASVLLDKIRAEKKRLVKEGKLKKKDLEETPISEDEKPFKIPESWEWVRLGTLISYQNGYAYNSSEMNKEGKGVPVIKSGNLMTLEVVFKPNNDYIECPTEKMLLSKIVKGDMLMCLSSQSDNPEPLGKTAVYKLDTYALLNQRVLKFRPYKDELTPYLYHTINSFYFWYNVSHQGGGSAQANLKLNHVLDMQIPLPPFAEQKRIVAKIEELFAVLDSIKESLEV